MHQREETGKLNAVFTTIVKKGKSRKKAGLNSLFILYPLSFILL